MEVTTTLKVTVMNLEVTSMEALNPNLELPCVIVPDPKPQAVNIL